MIHVRELVKSYEDVRLGQFTAVDRVSFYAMPGQIFGLLGPNGAGKTTVLRILSTVLEPTSGTVQVAGYDAATQPAMVRHQIGFMSANTAVYDRMTAWEMVQFFGRLYGMDEARLKLRMDELFSRLKMDDIRDVLGAKMSTGMKQKVSIARTLIHDPPVLIFDEPTLGLDVFVARALLQIIGELRDQGKCIIFSSHIMREVEKLCDQVAIMHKGKILASGSLAELKAQFQQDDLEEVFFHLIGEPDPESQPTD